MNQEFEILQANMKILRILSDCSQEETAEKLHISRSTYASYEAGFRTPDLVILQKLSRLYDVSLSDLVYLPLDDLLYSQLCIKQNLDLFSEILPLYENLSPSAKNRIMEKINALREGEKLLTSLHRFCTFQLEKTGSAEAPRSPNASESANSPKPPSASRS